jgi:hypothetical protein
MAKIQRIERQLLESWDDLLFLNKSRGYVAVVDFLKPEGERQKSYGSNDIQKIKLATENQEKKYISLNAFSFGSRRVSDLLQVRNIGIDLDGYKLGLSPEQVKNILYDMITENIIPCPNMVTSSRGVQLWYTIDGGASPKIAWLTSYITEQFITKLLPVGADIKAKDLARVFRAPYSINEKNNAQVIPEIWTKSPYTIDRLQDYTSPIPLRNTKSTSKLLHFKLSNSGDIISHVYRVNQARVNDLELLVELRGGDFTHKRNDFLYTYGYHQALKLKHFPGVVAFASQVWENVFSRAKDTFTDKEFMNTLESSFGDAMEFSEWWEKNNYRIITRSGDGIIKPHKSQTIIEKLEITPDEQRALKTLHTPEISRELDAQRKRQERHSKGVQDRATYLENIQATKTDKREQVQELKKQGKTASEIGLELGISRASVYRLL